MANKEANLLLRIKTAGEDALSKITFTFGDLVNVAKALGEAMALPIEEFKQTEQATKSLTQALVNNGVYSKELKDSYIEQANALSMVSLYEGDQILTAQAALQQQIGSLKITKELTTAILDFATAQKMDVASAAEVVGKTIGTSTNALGRYGIEVNSAASESQKMAQVIDGLNNKFGGQAATATEGLGALDMFKKSVMDVAEAVGAEMAPTLTMATQSLLQFVQTSPVVEASVNAIGFGFKLLVSMGYGVVEVFNLLSSTVEAVIGTLSVSIQSVALLMEGKWTAAWETLKSGSANALQTMGTDYQNYQNKVNAIWDSGTQKQTENLALEEQMLAQSLDRKIALQEQKAIENGLKQQDIDAQNRQYQLDLMNAQHEEDMALLLTNEDQKQLALVNSQMMILQAAIKHQNDLISNATTQEGKLKALKDKARMEESLADMTHKKNELERQAKHNKMIEEDRASTLALLSTMQNSSNKEMAFLGKAAALTQIAIETPVAISRALSAFPPPFNFVAAAGVAGAMATQAAKVAGIPLAEGGIVMPRPGGTQATIGEAGSAEAVIPLDKYPGLLQGGGQTINLTINGGLLGDQSSAYELARALDRELLKLRQNNESAAFDSGVI